MARANDRYSLVLTASIRTGRVPSAQHYRDIAMGYNYLVGHGTELIPHTEVYVSGSRSGANLVSYFSASVAYRIRYLFEPCAGADRTWIFQMTGSGEACIVSNISGSGVTGSANQTPFILYEASYPTSGAVDSYIQFQFSAPTSGSERQIYRAPQSIQCFEVPRLYLSGAIEEATFRGRSPLFDSGQGQTDSVGAIYRAMPIALVNTRRAGLFAWLMPYARGGTLDPTWAWRASGTTYRQFFLTGSEPLIQPRKVYRNQVSSSVSCAFFCWSSVPLTGTIRVMDRATGLSGTVLYSGSGAVPMWLSTSVPLYCDNYNEMAGVPVSSSYLKIEARSESIGSLYISSIIVGESWKSL